MQLQNEGRYRGYAVNTGVAEHGENKVLQFSADFHLVEVLDQGQWVPLAEPAEITGFAYLTKKDRTLNTSAIDKLKAAFHWNGADPFWLQDNDLSQILVQVTTKFDTYNNKTRIKVQWIDAADAEGSIVKRADDSEKRRIAASLGAKFRANAGGTSATPPVPPKTTTNSDKFNVLKISGQEAPPAAPPAPRPPAAKSGTYEQAWEAFAKAYAGEGEKRDDQWWFCLRNAFGATRAIPGDVTPQEWGQFIVDVAGVANVPF